MTDLAIQEIARAMCIAYNQVLLNQPDDERNQPLAMEAAYAVARKHIEAEVRIEALEQARTTEFICKCGLRVEPHRCRDTEGTF